LSLFAYGPATTNGSKQDCCDTNKQSNQPQIRAEWPTICVLVSKLFELGEHVFLWPFSNTFGFLCKLSVHYDHFQTVLFWHEKKSYQGQNRAGYSLLCTEVSAMIKLGVFYFYAAIPHTIVTFRIRPGHYEWIQTGLLWYPKTKQSTPNSRRVTDNMCIGK
jgi:hypothetical protein